MGDGAQRRCIEVHPRRGLRCEARYQHKGAHSYGHMGAMPEPIVWQNLAPLPSRARLAWRVLVGEHVTWSDVIGQQNDGSSL